MLRDSESVNYLIGVRVQFHHDVYLSGHVLRQINSSNKRMFSRPRFTECEDKTRQGNGLQEHSVAAFFNFFGYDLADDQRQGKAFGFLELDAEVIFRSILLRQVGKGIALDEHGTLPGYFSTR